MSGGMLQIEKTRTAHASALLTLCETALLTYTHAFMHADNVGIKHHGATCMASAFKADVFPG